MQFTTTTLAAILAFTSTTVSSPLVTSQAALEDWQLTELNIGVPSGRVGSYPWATITAQITDPNVLDVGTAQSDGSTVTAPAGSKGLVTLSLSLSPRRPPIFRHINSSPQNCQAKYFTKGENPLDHTWPCDAVPNGYWTMQILPGSEGTYKPTNFKAKFTHVAEVTYKGEGLTASFEGEVGINGQLSGQCGGSGVCGWQLKGPVAVSAAKV